MRSYAAYSAASRAVDEENKPRILLTVYEGILDKFEIVKSAIEKKDFETKYRELSKITTIIDILTSSLDMSQGVIPRNLASLYDYIGRRILEVHTSLDTGIIDECKSIISNLHEGFAKAYEAERKKERVDHPVPERTEQARHVVA